MVAIERVWGGVKITYTNNTGTPATGGFNTLVDGAVTRTHAPLKEFGIIAPGQTVSMVMPLNWALPPPTIPPGQPVVLKGKHSLAIEFTPGSPDKLWETGYAYTETSNIMEVDFAAIAGGVLTWALILGGSILLIRRLKRS